MIIGKITGKRGFWDTLRKVIAVKNTKIAVCLPVKNTYTVSFVMNLQYSKNLMKQLCGFGLF